MKVREWIERLSEIDPEYEVLAVKSGTNPEAHRVVPVEAQLSTVTPGMPCEPFVKIVKEDG